MSKITVKVKDLKSVVAKMNLAIEKTKINPKAGWIEVEQNDNVITLRVGNYEYYMETEVPIVSKGGDGKLHSTITSDTFVPLVAKLETDEVVFEEATNALILETGTSEYTFPMIKEGGKTKPVDRILFTEKEKEVIISGADLASISTTNANGLIDSIFAKEIQQFIYVDNRGALTFTENIYVNDFKTKIEEQFKFLLSATQAKLLSVFSEKENVKIEFAPHTEYESSNKVRFIADNILLVIVTQSDRLTDTFPAIKLRNLADSTRETHVVVNKQALDKALARLMVFDKKFDITVMAYSKLVWKTDCVELVSIKNHNKEVISYISSQGAFEHESIIRFADLVRQLKAVTTKEIDISYSTTPAIVINNCDGLKQVLPEVQLVERA